MKKISFTLLILLFAINSFGQVNLSEILLGKPLLEVKEYFKELEKKYPESKIREMDDEGNLVLIFTFPASEELKTKSKFISTTFDQTDPKQMCFRYRIFFTDISLSNNLKFLKDNFSNLGNDTYLAPYNNDKHKELNTLKVLAEFKKSDNTYTIGYRLTALNPK